MESMWWLCIWMMFRLVPSDVSGEQYIHNYRIVFSNFFVKERFIYHPTEFLEYTTHLSIKPFIEIMDEWRDQLNILYFDCYKAQDASPGPLERIKIDEETLQSAYDSGNENLESLKVASMEATTNFVSITKKYHQFLHNAFTTVPPTAPPTAPPVPSSSKPSKTKTKTKTKTKPQVTLEVCKQIYQDTKDLDGTSFEGLTADGQTSKRDMLSMVSVAEARSEHPLAYAIAHYGKYTLGPHTEPTIESFESVTGQGTPTKLQKFTDRESAKGRSVVFASLSKLPILTVSLSDVPKPSSAPAIKALHSMASDECGWVGMSSKGKAAKIVEMGKGVAMVGDEINDSPALVAASVGIALSSGMSIAVEAADIVLMRSSLLDVVAALHLSRSIFSTIRRNLVWA
ncbi:hypothetical protein V565_292130, partial [Rhizoctonia solani 123E]